MRLALTLALCAAAGCGAARPITPAPASAPAPTDTGAARLRREAAAMEPLATSDLARAFLRTATALPAVPPRVVWHDAAKTRYLTETEAANLAPAAREGLVRRALDEEYYYSTGYGGPIPYARPLDLLAAAGLGRLERRRVLDFGFGAIGQLVMLAMLGADVVGVEVDPLVRALYQGDEGPVAGRNGARGRLALVVGRFPADPAVVQAVGGGYDLIVAKNVLKNGYLHPAEPVPERKRIRLGVSDEEFVRTLHRLLTPGGRVMIYNLCPAPAPPGQPYIPWADGRSPFPRAMLEAAGFRVVAFDVDDTAFARRLGRVLAWDRGPDAMDLDRGLFAWYTLLEKPTGTAPATPAR
jgi:SAM-dependent methyltransferase